MVCSSQLYRNFEPLRFAASLGSKLAADLVEEVRRQPRELTRVSDADDHHCHPAAGPG